MKLLCDVCGGAEAAVFCSADEAALCAACDSRVHQANKLAGKHFRFSLLSAGAGGGGNPLCDICQEKQGIVFCKEDRAILCPDCDSAIHQANRLTMKHCRFILTGIRLSAEPDLDGGSAAVEAPATGSVGGSVCADQIGSTLSAVEPVMSGGGGGSSISEYLTKMLPGYCVEDFLADDSLVAAGDPFYERVYQKLQNDELLPFVEESLAGAGIAPAASPAGTEAADRGFPIWFPYVPEIPPLPPPDGGAGHKGISDGCHLSAAEAPGRKQWNEDGFTVPEMLPATGTNKRARSSANWYF